MKKTSGFGENSELWEMDGNGDFGRKNEQRRGFIDAFWQIYASFLLAFPGASLGYLFPIPACKVFLCCFAGFRFSEL